MLRTLLPESGHLAQNKAHNSLVIFDRKANIDKITDIISSLEKYHEGKPTPCTIPSSKNKT